MSCGAATAPAAGPSAVALAVAGSATVATAFGMARYGYGLLLPDIQKNLALGARALGAIGTVGYVAYVLAAALVSSCVARAGERGTVVAGGLFAVAGTILVALADGPALLGAGVAIAGASAGLVYPPFADAVARLPAAVRARTLSTINCGTGWGVAVAAPIAILAGSAWRAAYLAFAGCAALSTLHVARTLPARASIPVRAAIVATVEANPAAPRVRRAALPMLTGALLVGLGSAAFWTFAVDQVHQAGLDQTAGRALLGVAGVTSILGIGAADVIRRLGAGRTFVLTALLEGAAIATIGVAAHSVIAVLLAGAVFGAAYKQHDRRRHGAMEHPRLRRPPVGRRRHSGGRQRPRAPLRPARRRHHCRRRRPHHHPPRRRDGRPRRRTIRAPRGPDPADLLRSISGNRAVEVIVSEIGTGRSSRPSSTSRLGASSAPATTNRPASAAPGRRARARSGLRTLEESALASRGQQRHLPRRAIQPRQVPARAPEGPRLVEALDMPSRSRRRSQPRRS
ncbi:MAG: MFS transporter [Solirubrobacteraceae bacterium]